MDCLTLEMPKMLKSKNIGLLVLDSIAATFRAEYEDDTKAKAHDLRIIGRALHDIAFRNNLVLVCLNQVIHIFLIVKLVIKKLKYRL